MFNFFEFSGSYKNIDYKLFWVHCLILIVSVLSTCFFLSELKIEDECCLVENMKHLFKLDCETEFMNLCPLHKAWVSKFCFNT